MLIMTQKSPLTALTVMYADRWNGIWSIELKDFRHQLMTEYHLRFLITSFLRLKRQWLFFLSVNKSGGFYFFQIATLNYLFTQQVKLPLPKNKILKKNIGLSRNFSTLRTIFSKGSNPSLFSYKLIVKNLKTVFYSFIQMFESKLLIYRRYIENIQEKKLLLLLLLGFFFSIVMFFLINKNLGVVPIVPLVENKTITSEVLLDNIDLSTVLKVIKIPFTQVPYVKPILFSDTHIIYKTNLVLILEGGPKLHHSLERLLTSRERELILLNELFYYLRVAIDCDLVEQLNELSYSSDSDTDYDSDGYSAWKSSSLNKEFIKKKVDPLLHLDLSKCKEE